jgi:DNA modification methylase
VCGKCGAVRVDAQIGLEGTPQEYVAGMVEIFAEVRRVLRDDGVCFVNVGDSYFRNPGRGVKFQGGNDAVHDRQAIEGNRGPALPVGAMEKSLCLIPERLAIALSDDGWIIRNRITWAKGLSFCPTWSGSVMPSSAGDRFTPASEPVWFMAKSTRTQRWFHRGGGVSLTPPAPEYVWRHRETGLERPCRRPRLKVRVPWGKGEGQEMSPWARVNLWRGQGYWFDQVAVREPAAQPERQRTDTIGGASHQERQQHSEGGVVSGAATRNLRDVWCINTEPSREDHYAAYPEALVEPCVLAGSSDRACSECGAAWVRQVEKSGETSHGGLRKRADAPGVEVSPTSVFRTGMITQTHTTGFAPGCTCGADTCGSLILDPFCGSGTTGAVAVRLGRRFLGIELNPTYVAMSERRIAKAEAEAQWQGEWASRGLVPPALKDEQRDPRQASLFEDED